VPENAGSLGFPKRRLRNLPRDPAQERLTRRLIGKLARISCVRRTQRLLEDERIGMSGMSLIGAFPRFITSSWI
jgi:hypothetical protein